MPIKPEDFYVAAQDLNGMQPPLVSDEVCGRTMLNRMYYAAYLNTREAVRAQLGVRTFDVSHTSLAETLMKAADPDVRELGSRLLALKRAREDADYRPHLSVTKTVAALHLDNARFVLNNAGRLVGRFPLIRAR
jgi:hypothetical protein